MKSIFFFALVLFSFVSCVSEKAFYRDFKKEALVGKSPNEKVFIVKKNGEKITGDTITYSKNSIWRVKQKENWIAVDGKKINREDIQAVQSESEYWTYFSISKITTRSITRLRYGKINLYTYEQTADVANSNGQKDFRGNYHVYVFEKTKGILEQLTYENFNNAIKDNEVASRQFHSRFPKAKILKHNEKGNLKNLIAVVEAYNTK